MPRACPRDDSYPATAGRAFSGTNGGVDADLLSASVGPAQCPFAAAEVIVTNVDETAEATMVVRMQGEPSTDVSFVIGAGTTMWIRGAFVTYRTTSGANIRATFLWQGGPS